MGTYPDEFVPIQCHIGDGYAFWWTGQRASFYGVTGTPTTWFDGLLSCVGAYQNDQQMINWYNSQIVNRLGVPTDVTIDVYGVETGTQTAAGKFSGTFHCRIRSVSSSTTAWPSNASRSAIDPFNGLAFPVKRSNGSPQLERSFSSVVASSSRYKAAA